MSVTHFIYFTIGYYSKSHEIRLMLMSWHFEWYPVVKYVTEVFNKTSNVFNKTSNVFS